MNRKNIFQRYLFRKDFFWKVKEKLFWFIRNNSRNAFKDQRILLNYIENDVILDVGAHIGDTTELYRKYLHPVSYFLGKIFGRLFNLLGNLNHFFTSRILCFWVGGYDEIEFVFKKNVAEL